MKGVEELLVLRHQATVLRRQGGVNAPDNQAR